MTEKEQFCYDICQAARRLHIYARTDTVNGVMIVTFFDVMPRTKIPGDGSSDHQEALFNACTKLVDYLSIHEKHDDAATPSS